MKKQNLLISFSGGRTSAFMLYWLWNNIDYQEKYNIKVVFANTGKEAEETLKFVYEFSINFKIPVVWVEYRAGSEKGWKVNPKIVDFYTASREGEPFEDMIKHVGIPSTNTPFCSTILKNRTIKAYLRQIKFTKYFTAIGIRSDEVDRVSSSYIKDRVIYPLISSNKWDYLEMTKPEIINWWNCQHFDLKVHEDEGNCDNCWKKDFPRLVRNYKRNPESFDWWTKMQDEYGDFNPRNTKLKPPFNFYRGNNSTHDIAIMSNLSDSEILELTKNNKLNSCSESCEAFG